MACKSPIEGGTLIASNPTKQIEMMIGIVQLNPSCVSNHFENLFVHVASYFLKVPSQGSKKKNIGGSLPKLKCSSQVEVKCWQTQVIRSSGFMLGLRKRICVKRVEFEFEL